MVWKCLAQGNGCSVLTSYGPEPSWTTPSMTPHNFSLCTTKRTKVFARVSQFRSSTITEIRKIIPLNGNGHKICDQTYFVRSGDDSSPFNSHTGTFLLKAIQLESLLSNTGPPACSHLHAVLLSASITIRRAKGSASVWQDAVSGSDRYKPFSRGLTIRDISASSSHLEKDTTRVWHYLTTLTPKLQLCVCPFQINQRLFSIATPFR